jgi:predicted membrane protein
MKKFNKIFWGLFFLVSAGFVMLNQFDRYINVGILPLILAILILAVLIKSIYPPRFFGIMFSIAGLVLLYDNIYGIEGITTWPVLFTALLSSIGLSIIFGKHYNQKSCDKHFDRVISDKDEDIVYVDLKFGSSIKYVNTDNFKEANLNCRFGDLAIYFNNAKIKGDNATINLDASFSGVEIYIPNEWKVINNIDNNLAGIEEKNNHNSETNKTVTITGRVSFAGVEIIYI